ncbi:hypothetical protein PC120_g6216 [Phytophthora cactorum]|nr:hypothetical protein PC120_g6216 [Phytophthora cactorum]
MQAWKNYTGNSVACFQIWHHKWENGTKRPHPRCVRGIQNRAAGSGSGENTARKRKRQRSTSDADEGDEEDQENAAPRNGNASGGEEAKDSGKTGRCPTFARSTTNAPPLRTSKCATKRKSSPAEPEEPHKGMKHLVDKPAGTNEKFSSSKQRGPGISGAPVRLSTPGPDRQGDTVNGSGSVATAVPAEPSGGSTEPELVSTASSAAESAPGAGQTLLSGANTGGRLQGQLVETPSLSLGAARAQHVVPRGDGFNLNDPISSLRPGSASLQSPRHEETNEAPDRTAIPSESMSELSLQRDEVHRLRRQVANPQTMPDRVTVPNALGALPPAAICQLTCFTFPVELKKANSDYQPPQALKRTHWRPAGCLREAEGVAFRTTPAVLMAVFSGRLGASGLTTLHFKSESEAAVLEAGYSNGNFASDFSPTAALPRAEANVATTKF